METLWHSTGFMTESGALWQNLIMLVIACVLIYLAVYKEFEPNLLLAIGFGMFIINIPGSYNILYGTYGYVFTNELTNATLASGTVDQLREMAASLIGELPGVDWGAISEADLVTRISDYLVGANADLLGNISNVAVSHQVVDNFGLFFYLYKGVEWVIYPPLIFLGIGAMTDFGPLIANPKSMIMGAAAQVGIFVTFIIAIEIGFTGEQAAAIGIIGGADGPTSIYVTSKLAPELLGAIAVAAYSYMALVPVIQPPIMKLLTNDKERQIQMEQLRSVSKREKIIFPLVVLGLCIIFLPDACPLVGALTFGNLCKECGVVDRLSDTMQNALINIVTIFLGLSVGSKLSAEQFLTVQTLFILLLGIIAFSFATAAGVVMAKLMNLCIIISAKIQGKEPKLINPLIGSAGVSAVPMAARVSNKVGLEYNSQNYLLMHAMGPNVAGVIGSAVAAGVLLALCH